MLAVGEPPRVDGGEIGVESLPDLETPYALIGNRECGCHRRDRDGQCSATLAKSACAAIHWQRILDELENLARDEAFEAADDLAFGLAFRCASRNVVDGACVTGGHSHEHDAMNRGVDGAVTAPGEPVPLMLT